jgi:tetratricopeptide (TPR) repeat protein
MLFSPVRLPVLWVFALLLLVWFDNLAIAQTADPSDDGIVADLKLRVERHPDDGAAWRLLAKALIDRQMFPEAESAAERAVALRPLSVAALFDLGTAKQALNKKTEARAAYETVLDLAPDGENAEAVKTELMKLGEEEVVLAGFEVRQFDGQEYLEPLEESIPPRRVFSDRFDGRVEMGLLYNSNVALAPVSRQLAPGDRASGQLFVSPELEWTLRDETTWRTGPTLRGHFTRNQSDFENFNLQSYRPGWFAEWFLFSGEQIFIPRVDYQFTHDEFAGRTFGNRQALLSSLAAYWSDKQATVFFYSLDNTNFVRDGILPAITSQDGWSHSIGVSHDVATPYRFLRLVRTGLDLTQTDTKGSDYRFHGVNLFAEGIIPLAPTIELTIGGGGGYRDYFDFEFSPPRDEWLWNANAELRKYFSETLSAAIVMDYDKFDSKNPIFAAERFITGGVVEFRF